MTPRYFTEQDLIVVSPGVPANLPELELARKRGIPVWSEIELAWRFLRGTLIAITGSNGKTTTTSLVAHILKTAGIPMLVGGNIGVPLLSLRGTLDGFDSHRRGNQQLSAGNDRCVSSGSRRPAESDARSSRPPRNLRRICARENAHVRKSTRTRCCRPQRGRSRSYAPHAFAPAHFLVQPPEARRTGRIPSRRSNCLSHRRARKSCSAAATKSRCAANTTSKTSSRLALRRILAGADPAAIAAGVKTFQGRRAPPRIRPAKSRAFDSTTTRKRPTWTPR